MKSSLLLFALLLGCFAGHQQDHVHEYGHEHSQEELGRAQETLEELERKWGFEVCLFLCSLLSQTPQTGEIHHSYLYTGENKRMWRC